MPVRCRRLGSIAVVLFVLSFLAAAAVSAQEDVAGQVFRRINRAREEAGISPLERNLLLDAAAQAHANDLLQNGSQLGHRGSDGSNIRQRIARAGYPIETVGENWAGYRSLDKIMDFWMADPPHRKNILKAKYRDIGIGVAIRPNGGLIVVTDFGGGGAPPARENGNQPEVAPQAVEPTALPPEPTPVPPPPTEAPPPPEPTSIPPPPPTAVPTLIPTPVPVPTMVALVQSPVVTKPMRLRGKMQKIRVQAEANAAYGTPRARGDTRRMLMGGTLTIGGALLFGIAMLGHRRYRMRW